jgi:hypothetical protein
MTISIQNRAISEVRQTLEVNRDVKCRSVSALLHCPPLYSDAAHLCPREDFRDYCEGRPDEGVRASTNAHISEDFIGQQRRRCCADEDGDWEVVKRLRRGMSSERVFSLIGERAHLAALDDRRERETVKLACPEPA